MYHVHKLSENNYTLTHIFPTAAVLAVFSCAGCSGKGAMSLNEVLVRQASLPLKRVDILWNNRSDAAVEVL